MTSHPRKHYYYTSNHLRQRINIDYAAAALERSSPLGDCAAIVVTAARRRTRTRGTRIIFARARPIDEENTVISDVWSRRCANIIISRSEKPPRRRRSREIGMPRDMTIGALSATRGSDVVNFPRKLLNREKCNAYRNFVSRDVPRNVFNTRKYNVCGSLITLRSTRWSGKTVIDRCDGPACHTLFVKWQRSRRRINSRGRGACIEAYEKDDEIYRSILRNIFKFCIAALSQRKKLCMTSICTRNFSSILQYLFLYE